MNKKKISQTLSKFEGVYCSGVFMKDPAMVTALALIFENVHLLNHLEYVIEFSKRFRLALPPATKEKLEGMIWEVTPISDDSNEEGKDQKVSADPFADLSEEEKKTAYAYLFLTDSFCFSYPRLFPKVFKTDLYPKGKLIEVELVEERMPLRKNLYKVTKNSMIVSAGETKQINELISKGVIPIVGAYGSPAVDLKSAPSFSAKQVAALLAMKSVEMMLPSMREASDEIILEARERLSDHLPPFWASMLKMSLEMKTRIDNCKTVEEAFKECQDVVDTVVRPNLIELNEKLIKERRNWFYRILSPVAKGLKVIVGNPPITPAGLISASLSLGADIAVDLSQYKLNAGLSEAGLTYLLQLGEVGAKYGDQS